MRAGKMRDRVTLQTWQKTTDPRFNEAGEWVPLDTVWAAVVPLKGSEQTNAEGVVSQIDHEVTIRYRDDLDARAQVVYRTTRILDVVSAIDPDGRKRILILQSVEHPQVTP